ncbi:unnamed protein product [Penicillium salamii]|uniref:Uncharacterized protein n=1 Tax=Penicillium salamii TaxID=1612424 RepID=A0A9W4N3E8_9EURO|nr:unnamed protein product [Penicillium salamii]
MMRQLLPKKYHDDKYTAYAGLTNKTIMTNPTLKTIDKALSNPKSLNDNKAIADACGSGYIVAKWDDTECGKLSCYYKKPIYCPTASTPKNCNWRSDNIDNTSVSSDYNAQCKSREINIVGIKSL